jgi:hypothetical protein
MTSGPRIAILGGANQNQGANAMIDESIPVVIRALREGVEFVVNVRITRKEDRLYAEPRLVESAARFPTLPLTKIGLNYFRKPEAGVRLIAIGGS